MADTVILANCRYGRKNANFTPEGALWENPRTDLSRKPRLFAGYHMRVDYIAYAPFSCGAFCPDRTRKSHRRFLTFFVFYDIIYLYDREG